MMATSGVGRPIGTAALIVIWVAVVGLASGLPASLAVMAGWSAGSVVLPPLVVALLVVATRLDVARAVRPLLFVVAASMTGLWVITVGLGAAQRMLAGWPLAVQILVVNGAKVVPVALTAAVVLRYRPSREDSALRVGQWRADSGLRVAGRPVDWRWIGGTVAVVVCGGTIATGVGAFSGDGLRAALVWLPVYAAAAVINSAAEEFLFRHAVNAVTRRLVSRFTLIALTSLYFGVTHLNGTPSGPVGVLLTSAFGVILALAIDHTRGFCWNWTLHFLGDLAIFFTLIATASPT